MKRSDLTLVATIMSLLVLLLPQISSAVGSGTAIDFENDNVFVGYGAVDFEFTGEITVSSWVKWDRIPTQSGSNSENQWANIVSNNSYKDSDDGQFWLQHDKNNEHFEFVVNTDMKHAIISKTQPDSGIWYHVTGVYNKNLSPKERFRIYVNGVEETEFSSANISGNIKEFNNSYLFKVGRWSYSCRERFFSGDIDEVNVWNRALSSEEIKELICSGLTGEEEGIVGYWKFNEGEGDIVFDQTLHQRNGIVFFESGIAEGGGSYTLRDIDKSWKPGQWGKHTVAITAGRGFGQERTIDSNTDNTITVSEEWEIKPDFTTNYAISSKDRWVLSEAPMGDASSYKYTDNWFGEKIILSHDDGDSVMISSINGNPDGVHLYRVDESPMNNEPPNGWAKLDPLRYWGVLLIGGDEPSYTITYNYDGHPGILLESDLGMARHHSIYSPWENTGAIPDTIENTLTSVGETGTEFILMDHYGNNPLPVTITNFTAYASSGAVSLKWRTECEYDNTIYCLYRSSSYDKKYECVSQIPGSGSSSLPQSYYYVDNDVTRGHSYYYKLVEISEIYGRNEYGPIKVNLNANNSNKKAKLEANYPNPFKFETAIKFSLIEGSNICLSVYDASGRLVRNILSSHQRPGINIAVWDGKDCDGEKAPEGLYFVVLKADSEIMAARKMVLIK